jgi:hypothetical protein
VVVPKSRPKKLPHPFSCTDDLWDAIQARAKQLRLSASQYLATLAYNEIDSPTLSLTIKPAPGTKKPKVSPEML